MKQIDRIENKLDVIDVKLDDHLERLSKAEESIEFLKGHVKITITLGIAILGSALTYIINTFGD